MTFGPVCSAASTVSAPVAKAVTVVTAVPTSVRTTGSTRGSAASAVSRLLVASAAVRPASSARLEAAAALE